MDPITRAAREAVAPVPPEVWLTYRMHQAKGRNEWKTTIFKAYATQELAQQSLEERAAEFGEPVAWEPTEKNTEQLRSQEFVNRMGTKIYYFVLPREVLGT